MKWDVYPNKDVVKHEWFGKIPSHWDTIKFKKATFFQEGPGLRNWQFTDEGVRVICVTNITEGGIDFSNYEKFISQDEYEESYRRFTVGSGDLLLSSSGNSWGKVAEYTDDEKVILNTSTIRINELKDGKLLKRFIKWMLQSKSSREQLGLMMTGACQPNFGPSHLSDLIVTLPPMEDQHSISKYLDRETFRVNNLIIKKERQIKLLQEKRSAIISHAVTKGLNPDAKLKDSGVKWLGKIPEHWHIRRLKYCSTVNDESLAETTDPAFELTYVDISSVDAVNGINKKLQMVFEEAPSRARRIVRNGDTIISTVRTYLRAIAPIEQVEENLIVSTGFAVVRPRKIRSKFLAYVLLSSYFVENVVSRSAGVSYPAINASELTTIKIPIPDDEEQLTISNTLDHEIRQIDSLIQKIKKSIELLEEYRISLITAAVTGKIDVRKEAA